jgi:potassium-transporting ATPase KdpC subunit
MNLTRNLLTAILMTVATTLLLGLAYPLAVTALARAFFPEKADGQLIQREGRTIGSRIIGQGFSGATYFHPRPSAAGSGYDATSSGGTNLGPTNRKLIDAVASAVAAAQKENPGAPVPIDLVTSSASGLDPDITPDAAFFQVPRVARARGVSEADLRSFVEQQIEGRQWGILGEPRVNVLLLNLGLDEHWPMRQVPALPGGAAAR